MRTNFALATLALLAACNSSETPSRSTDPATVGAASSTPVTVATPASARADSSARSTTEVARPADPTIVRLAVANADVQLFFGAAFPRPFATEILPHRADLDAWFAKHGMPPSECWMVATGSADLFAMLDPAVWKVEACEHDGADEAHVRGIVTHELVHVFHGQHNKTRDFTGMDDLGWFVEGLAAYASGQMDREHKGKDHEALTKGVGPKDLATAWSGRYRYAVCGSLVRYVDQKHGREMLVRLLAATTPAEFHAMLGESEADLLAGWREAVLATPTE